MPVPLDAEFRRIARARGSYAQAVREALSDYIDRHHRARRRAEPTPRGVSSKGAAS